MSGTSKDTSTAFEEMNGVRFAGLSFSTMNLGDEIQTIAADRFIPRISRRFDRDKLRLVQDHREYVLILNGWYSSSPDTCFPIAENLIPAITGFHISVKSKDYLLSPQSIACFKRHEPIGCRDRQTMQWLHAAGVEAYFSKCLTLTLPRRTSEPVAPQVIIVDIPPHVQRMIPKEYRKNAVYLTHRCDNSPEEKLQRAQWLLDYYRDHAGLVITSRLHCALPCLAMGIPVVLFAKRRDYRFSVALDCGLKIQRGTLFVRSLRARKGYLRRKKHRIGILLDRILLKIWYKVLNKSVWRPEILDIEEHRMYIEDKVRHDLNVAILKWKNKQTS
jgi:hypothetical protein